MTFTHQSTTELYTLSLHDALPILQHPQEQDRMLGTARLAALQIENAVLRVGLSWSSLAKALGRPAEPRRWAILYLGSAGDRKSTRLNSSHVAISYAVFCLNKKIPY